MRSGKSQGAALLLAEIAATQEPSTYVLSRQTFREIEDSLKPMLLRGDGSLPRLIPEEAVADYKVTDNLIRLRAHDGRNDASILFTRSPAPGLGCTGRRSGLSRLATQLERDPTRLHYGDRREGYRAR